MDSLTQIVLGAAVGNAVLGTKIKNKAILYGAIAGTIPDLDVVIGLFLNPIVALEIHRGMSHSLLFATVLAVLLGYGLHRIEKDKGVGFREGFNLVFLGLVTHSFLDAFTTWGTEILWPWNYSFAFKSIFVVDPLYTVPFLFFLIKSMRETKNMKRRMKWNTYGLVISSAYLFVTLILKFMAYNKFEQSLDKQQLTFNSLAVKPTAFNTVLWNGIVEMDSSYWIGTYSFFDTREIEYQKYDKNLALLRNIEKEPVVARLIDLSNGEFTMSLSKDQLYFNDLRFGLLKSHPKDTQFAFSYHLFKDADGVWAAQEVKKEKRDGLLMLKNMWARIFAN